MVTWAGKELLKNTINTATFHNRILEENEMWKQWGKQCGLTMMVSDDDILKKFKKNHQCSKHCKRDKSRDRETHKPREINLQIAGPSKADVERWDHSGFQELYPDEDVQQEKNASTSSTKSHSNKQKKKKKRHRSSSASDSEIWEEFKRYKRSKKNDLHKSKSETSRKSTSSGYDNHVKEWKKRVEKSLKS